MRIGNVTITEYLKNGSNDFLEIRYINSLLDAFSNTLNVYYKKTDRSPN